MTRLHAELNRLYAPAGPGWIDATGCVRALVLELARPADWGLLGQVWRGVQSDLELPAPAIAVSGVDGFQLWFSLAEPVELARAQAFLRLLCARYLPGVAAQRLTLMPEACQVPALHAPSGNWSAFVAPDLAPVFADTPWLDIPPSEEGQADVLCRLQSIKPAAFEAAWARLQAATPQPEAATPTAPVASAGLSPQQFLLKVMNDEAVPLAQRIEAAKALLAASNTLKAT